MQLRTRQPADAGIESQTRARPEPLSLHQQGAEAVPHVQGRIAVGQEGVGVHGLEGVGRGQGQTRGVRAPQVEQEGIGRIVLRRAAHGPHREVAHQPDVEGLLQHHVHPPEVQLTVQETLPGHHALHVQHGPTRAQGHLAVRKACQTLAEGESHAPGEAAGQEVVPVAHHAFLHGFRVPVADVVDAQRPFGTQPPLQRPAGAEGELGTPAFDAVHAVHVEPAVALRPKAA